MAASVDFLHRHHHDDYNIAKNDIAFQLGDLGDMVIFGKQLLIAVYVRPAIDPKTGWSLTKSTQAEDIYQGKVGMILRLGPSAFAGDDSYLKAMYGGSPPKPGDWVFMSANAGLATNFVGENAGQVVVKARNGEDVDQYGFAGWPCRIVPDDSLIGLIVKPHSVV